MKKFIFLVALACLLVFYPKTNALADSNNLIIEKVTTSPEIVEPGDQFKINFTLKNNASREIQNITIKLVGIEGKNSLSGFSPLNTTNEIYCGNIQKSKTSEASISMISDPQLKAGTYNLLINLTFKEKGGRSFEENRIIGIVLTNKSNLMITSFETPEEIKDKAESKLKLDFVNTGKAVLKDVLLTLNVNDKKYVKYYGSVEPGDENNYEQKLDISGNASGSVEITFKDEMNREGKINKDFSIKGEENKPDAKTKSDAGFFSSIGNFFKRLLGLGA